MPSFDFRKLLCYHCLIATELVCEFLGLLSYLLGFSKTEFYTNLNGKFLIHLVVVFPYKLFILRLSGLYIPCDVLIEDQAADYLLLATETRS